MSSIRTVSRVAGIVRELKDTLQAFPNRVNVTGLKIPEEARYAPPVDTALSLVLMGHCSQTTLYQGHRDLHP